MSISGSCALMDDCSSCTLMEGAECAWCSKTERCTGATTAFGNLESTGCSFNELYVRDSECFIISKTIPWMAVCAMLGVRLLFFFRSRLPVIRIRTFFNQIVFVLVLKFKASFKEQRNPKPVVQQSTLDLFYEKHKVRDVNFKCTDTNKFRKSTFMSWFWYHFCFDIFLNPLAEPKDRCE